MRFGRADLRIADKMGGAPLERWSLAARAWIEAAFVHCCRGHRKLLGTLHALPCSCCISPFLQKFLASAWFILAIQLKASTPLQSHMYKL